ncbi:Ig-like domain-containing protein [Parasediminibacterium sp. JCM 36343]|uniref:Ig-like domain-containing protein n=1 Tax=Parasediminibacterium sp. JCM 36343 TaxID=3374279 RepID=UPI003978F149
MKHSLLYFPIIKIKKILFLVLFAAGSQLYAQNYADGTGTGSLQKEIFWLNWNNGLSSRPADADSFTITEGQYVWLLSPGIKVIANLSNISPAGSFLKTDDFSAFGFSKYLYPGMVGTGLRDSLYRSTIAFDVSVDMQMFINGAWKSIAYPGMAVADGESLAESEYIKATLADNGASWHLLDLRNDFYPRHDSTEYQLIIGNGGKDFQVSLNLPPGETGDLPMQAVMYAKGAHQLLNVETKGRGYTAVGVGLLLPFDFGDAPASFGDAGHYIGDSITYTNQVLMSDGTYTAVAVAKIGISANAKVYMGGNTAKTKTDADGTPPHSPSANTDDITRNADEDGFKLSTQPTIQVNNASNITCYITVTNRQAVPATLYGWIDFNGDGRFTANEAATITVPAGASNLTDSLIFFYNNFGSSIKAGPTFARFRITTTPLIDNAATINLDERSTAPALDGEAEDYKLKDITTGSPTRPVGTNDIDSTPINKPVTTIVKSNDVVNAVTATVSIASSPLNGTVIVNADGTVTYTPLPGFTGKDSYTYTLTSPSGLVSTPINVFITVKPVGVNDTTIAPLNTPININVKNNDSAQGVNTTVGIVVNPANGTAFVNTATGVVTYIPSKDFVGKDTFTYTLSTPDGVVSAPVTVYITVTKRADLSITKDLITLPPLTSGQTIMFRLTVFNLGPNDATGVIALDTLAANLGAVSNIVTATGSPSYDPSTKKLNWNIGNLAASRNVTLTFTTTVDSGNNVNNAASVHGNEPDPDTTNNRVVIATVPVKPTGINDIDSTLINTPVTTPIKANDGTGAVKDTVKIAVGPTHGTTVVNPGGTVTYIPAPGFTGKDVYTYTLTNPDGTTSSPITVNVSVKPVGVPDIDTTPINTPIPITVKNNDSAQGGNCTVGIVASPLNGTVSINPATGIATYTPALGYLGKDSFYYSLTTPDGVVSAPIKVTVTVINNIIKKVDIVIAKTLVTPPPLVTGQDIIFRLIVINKGPDDATGVVAADTLSANLGDATNIIAPAGTTATYNATVKNIVWNIGGLSVNKTDTLTFTAHINGGTAVNNMAWAKGNEPEPDTTNNHAAIPTIAIRPTGVNDLDSTFINFPLTTIVKANDGKDAATDTVKIASTPKHGTVTINTNGTVTYTPATDFTGKDSITYTLTNAGGGVSTPITAVFFVKPVGVNDVDSTIVGTPVTTAVIKNDGGSGIGSTVKIASQPANGTVVANSNGTVTYTPNVGYTGVDTYTYILTTPDGLVSAPITVVVTVSPLVVIKADIGITKELTTKDIISIGETVSFSITVTNYGPDNATGVLATDTLATNLSNVRSITVNTGTATYNAATRALAWNIGNLSASQLVTLTFTAVVDSGSVLNNTASVTSNEPDPDLTNNHASLTQVTVYAYSIAIPNVITPNGDGLNEAFFITGLSKYPNSELSIFNRWDNLVYTSHDYRNDWDGRGLATGTYFYVLKVKLPTGGFDVRKGWVMLLK